MPSQLVAIDGAAGDGLGTSISVSGDVIFAGSPQADGAVGSNSGEVTAFRWDGHAWQTESTLAPADLATGSSFGRDVAVFGNLAVVGAPGSAGGRGTAYVFTRSGAGWLQQARLNATDGLAGDFFGASVAIFGDTIVVGAPGDQVGANSDQGSAFVFTRLGNTWIEDARIVAADGAANDQFGTSVALSADSFVAGVPGDDIGTDNDRGSVAVFVRNGLAWVQEDRLLGQLGRAGDAFGTSVDIAGDDVAVGGLR